MKTTIDCIPCLLRQTLEAIRMATDESTVQERALRKVLATTSTMDFFQSPPQIAHTIHRIIREETGHTDPYYKIKKHFNQLALGLYPELKKSVAHSPDRFETALRLAIAGNIIDFGPSGSLTRASIDQSLKESRIQPLDSEAVTKLKNSIWKARRVLYLGDNAGEIVFDRLLIEEMPLEKVVFAVRGFPIINDATREDAEEVGIAELVRVIENGSGIPGTVLEDCSQAFRQDFDRADVVIAKGQGNYETLSEVDKNIFFLFKVKCPVVAARCGHPVGAMVIHNRSGTRRTQNGSQGSDGRS